MRRSVLKINMMPVQSDDLVGLLLNLTSLAQVSHEGPSVGSRLESSVKLRQGQDTHILILSHALQGLSVVSDSMSRLAISLLTPHPLEVVNDEQANRLALLR
tara:strand:+ start:448 stop:753 length:306 start_codon:yes stop_codon:yes gene_type:complete